MTDSPDSIGKRVAQLRHGKKLSQQALATAAGVSMTYLRNLEQGVSKRAGSVSMLQKIAGVLNVSVSFLTGGDDARESLKVPLAGVIRAGLGDYAPDTAADESVDLRALFPDGALFLRVYGHSLEGLGIHDQDVIAVDRVSDPEAIGERAIAVVIVDGQYTLKYLQRGPAGRWLVMSCFREEGFRPLVIGESVELVGRLLRTTGERLAPSPGTGPKLAAKGEAAEMAKKKGKK